MITTYAMFWNTSSDVLLTKYSIPSRVGGSLNHVSSQRDTETYIVVVLVLVTENPVLYNRKKESREQERFYTLRSALLLPPINRWR
jgi:hypothetical protein